MMTGGPTSTVPPLSNSAATSVGQPAADSGVIARSKSSSTAGSDPYSTQWVVVELVSPSRRDGVQRAPLTQRTPRGQWLMQNDGRQPFASVQLSKISAPSSAFAKSR